MKWRNKNKDIGSLNRINTEIESSIVSRLSKTRHGLTIRHVCRFVVLIHSLQISIFIIEP